MYKFLKFFWWWRNRPPFSCLNPVKSPFSKEKWIDHCSFAWQGRLEMPTIHEGVNTETDGLGGNAAEREQREKVFGLERTRKALQDKLDASEESR